MSTTSRRKRNLEINNEEGNVSLIEQSEDEATRDLSVVSTEPDQEKLELRTPEVLSPDAPGPQSQTLSDDERIELERYENTINTSFREMVIALHWIKEKRLYREAYSSFEQYCAVTLNVSHRHGFYLARAGETWLALEGEWEGHERDVHILPTSEYQIRPLAKLDHPEEKANAWERAVELSKGKPSYDIVQQAVEEQLRKRSIGSQNGSKKRSTQPQSITLNSYVRIIGKTDKRLTRLRGCWAKVTNQNHEDESVTIAHAFGSTEAVSQNDLTVDNTYEPGQSSKQDSLLRDLQTIHDEHPDEDIASLVLHYFGELKRNNITSLERKVLNLLKKEKKNRTTEAVSKDGEEGYQQQDAASETSQSNI